MEGHGCNGRDHRVSHFSISGLENELESLFGVYGLANIAQHAACRCCADVQISPGATSRDVGDLSPSPISGTQEQRIRDGVRQALLRRAAALASPTDFDEASRLLEETSEVDDRFVPPCLSQGPPHPNGYLAGSWGTPVFYFDDATVNANGGMTATEIRTYARGFYRSVGLIMNKRASSILRERTVVAPGGGTGILVSKNLFLTAGHVARILKIPQGELFAQTESPLTVTFDCVVRRNGDWQPFFCLPRWEVKEIVEAWKVEEMDYALLRLHDHPLLGSAGDSRGYAPLRGWRFRRNDTVYVLGHPHRLQENLKTPRRGSMRLHRGVILGPKVECSDAFGAVGGGDLTDDPDTSVGVGIGASYGAFAGSFAGGLPGAVVGAAVGGLVGGLVSAVWDSYFEPPNGCVEAKGLNLVGGESGSAWMDEDGAVRAVTRKSDREGEEDNPFWAAAGEAVGYDISEAVATNMHNLLLRSRELRKIAVRSGIYSESQSPCYVTSGGLVEAGSENHLIMMRDDSAGHVGSFRHRSSTGRVGSNWSAADETALLGLPPAAPGCHFVAWRFDVAHIGRAWQRPSGATFCAYPTSRGGFAVISRAANANTWSTHPELRRSPFAGLGAEVAWTHGNTSVIVGLSSASPDTIAVVFFADDLTLLRETQIPVASGCVAVAGWFDGRNSHIVASFEAGNPRHFVSDDLVAWGDAANDRAGDAPQGPTVCLSACGPHPALSFGASIQPPLGWLGTITSNGQPSLRAWLPGGGWRAHWTGQVGAANPDAGCAVFWTGTSTPTQSIYSGGEQSVAEYIVSLAYVAHAGEDAGKIVIASAASSGNQVAKVEADARVNRLGRSAGFGVLPFVYGGGSVGIVVDSRQGFPFHRQMYHEMRTYPLSGLTGLPYGWTKINGVLNKGTRR